MKLRSGCIADNSEGDQGNSFLTHIMTHQNHLGNGLSNEHGLSLSIKGRGQNEKCRCDISSILGHYGIEERGEER